ncbi:MAG: hypothetical protein ACQERF_04845, partial [Actinomycetota bacterium]
MRHGTGTRRRSMLAWLVAALVVVAAAAGAWVLWSPSLATARGLALVPDLGPATPAVMSGDVVTLPGGDAATASVQLSEVLYGAAPVVAVTTAQSLAEARAAA